MELVNILISRPPRPCVNNNVLFAEGRALTKSKKYIIISILSTSIHGVFLYDKNIVP